MNRDDIINDAYARLLNENKSLRRKVIELMSNPLRDQVGAPEQAREPRFFETAIKQGVEIQFTTANMTPNVTAGVKPSDIKPPLHPWDVSPSPTFDNPLGQTAREVITSMNMSLAEVNKVFTERNDLIRQLADVRAKNTELEAANVNLGRRLNNWETQSRANRAI